MKKLLIFTFASLVVSSISSCQKEACVPERPMQEITLNLGFETRTYLDKGVVYWGTTEHVQVFTDKNEVYDFSTTESKVVSATFKGSIPVGDKIKYILSVTKTTAKNMSIDENGIISGTDIALTTSQNPSMPHSYKNGAACSIMKDGDTKLRNVFGLIKMTLPAYESGQSKIHHVEITADQYLAGRFAINYNGEEPTTGGIIVNTVAKKLITVTTRWDNTKFESGEIYAMLLPGTYTNVKFKVYPFAEEPTSKTGYSLGDPFEIAALSDVVITRNKWIDAGTIPASKPAAKTKCSTPTSLSAGVDGTKVTLSWKKYTDAEAFVLEVNEGSASVLKDTLAPAEVPYVINQGTLKENTAYTFKVKATSTKYTDSEWAEGAFETKSSDGYPNDVNALDYGLTGAWTSTIDSTKFIGYKSGEKVPAGGIVVDKVTYGEECVYYGNRIQIPECFDWDKTTYSVKMPLKRFFMFKINRPGTLSFIPYTSGTPTIVVALVTKKKGVTSAMYVEERSGSSFPNKNDEAYRQSIEITASHLSGIQESATVYLFSNSKGFHCYPITWTPTPIKKSSISVEAQDYSEGWTL